MQLSDSFGRNFKYLRLSITDVCNFKCLYCLPTGYCKTAEKEPELSREEIANLISAFALMGFTKIRFTGGEPTTRADLTELIQLAKSTPGISTVALTTNGWNLKSKAKEWRLAGLDAINISIDSLNPQRFEEIVGNHKLQKVLEGCDEALSLGFDRIKINSVLLKGLNEDELTAFCEFVRDRPISVRFIELMQTGGNEEAFIAHHFSGSVYRENLLSAGWKLHSKKPNDGPADEFSHPDYHGRIGLITPYANHFCESCNRLRVSSAGKLRLCLFGDEHYSLRPWLASASQKSALIEKIAEFVAAKPAAHLLKEKKYGRTQNFSEIGG